MKFFTRTKIICTIGPAVSSFEKIIELIDAGMNVARLNFSHGTHEEHLKTIQNLKRAREQKKVPLAIMLDTKGPKIRVGALPGGSIQVKQGLRLTLAKESKDPLTVPIHPIEVLKSVQPGAKILFDDGYIISQVVEKKEGEVVVEVQNRGVLKSEKGVNIPGAQLDLPAMTEADLSDLKFGCTHDVDLIAASFIRSAHHLFEIKEFLHQEGKGDLLVFAKIESAQGVENFDSIVQAADGIMVARGDLGVEVELAQVPRLQKMMIRKCLQFCKPVITATQMLESMISNPRPTRAEVSDVANAIYDGSSAVMLSAETAVGQYPIETVQSMKEIVRAAEDDFDYRHFFEKYTHRDSHNLSAAVSLAAVKTAYSAQAKSIFAFTTSGRTARLVSRLRPEMPILTLASHEKVYHQLAVDWGVIPLQSTCKDVREALEVTIRFALKKGLIAFGDVIVATSGAPFGKQGTTNMMHVETIGEILVRGHKGSGQKVHGPVVFVLSPKKNSSKNLRSCLVVLTHCEEEMFPFLKEAKGIILQNVLGDSSSEQAAALCAKTYDIPFMSRAEGAMDLLKEGEEVTLDPKRGFVYRGKEF